MTSVMNPSDRLTFHCDTDAHRIVVTGASGDVRYTFGGYGSQPGALNTPLAVALVQPEFYGEPPIFFDDAAMWLAVADYGNRRVQIFELDGALVGTIDDELIEAGIGSPSGLSWRAPVLEVEGTDGAHARIHLGAALLGRGPAPAAAASSFHMRVPHGFWERS
jgi:hypothetical protein